MINKNYTGWEGIAAGGDINPEGVGIIEPIGRAAPKQTGQNTINPLVLFVQAP